MMVARTCETCGNAFEVFPSAAKRGAAKYCKFECYQAKRNGKVEKPCLSCGRLFLMFNNDHERGRKYCGMECYRKVQAAKVRSVAERLWAKVEKSETCWNFRGGTAKGYGVIGGGSRNDQKYAHRISWELAFGEIPKGLFVCHHCDNPLCVRPDHLFVGTAADNGRDRVMKGRTITFLKKLREEKQCH